MLKKIASKLDFFPHRFMKKPACSCSSSVPAQQQASAEGTSFSLGLGGERGQGGGVAGFMSVSEWAAVGDLGTF